MLEKDFYKKIGFKKLSEIQEKAMNSDRSTLVLGSCGSGKSEMALSKILKWDAKSLLIEPMRTLATSLKDRLNEYSEVLEVDCWTIQHSSASEDKFLSNKFCVTTIDQVLAGYLGMGKQAFIKGKNIIKSNMVFDEVQLFDTEKMLLTTINMLDEIHKLGNKFIIMTATMPEYLINFLSERYDMNVIISETVRVKDRKSTIKYIDKLDINEINNYKNKQIIICNTLKSMLRMYKKLDEKRVVVLNSKFLKYDRERIENEMLKYFDKNSDDNDKILLTTQIVEAGMDISANRLYSANCPIDNLVQRDGRCARWGGDGEVVVFETDDKVYDKEVVINTKKIILENNGIEFSWNIQKDWINQILNPFYSKRINKLTLKKNKNNFAENSRDKLIRDIQNINVIIKNGEVTKEDFKRDSVGVGLYEFEKIAKVNKIHILKKGKVNVVDANVVESGETVVIEGKDCVYDELGFRFEENTYDNIKTFNMIKINKIEYSEYIEETWLEHALSVRNVFKERLLKERLNTYIQENIEEISFYGGMHDLGKLDKEWLKKCDGQALAHFPFTNKKGEYRDHAAISYYNIKNYTDKIISNIVLQHHKRYSTNNRLRITTTPWELHIDAKKILNKYGFNKEFIEKSDTKIIMDKDIITPKDKDWTTFLYLVGTLMECEIEAIQNHIARNNIAA